MVGFEVGVQVGPRFLDASVKFAPADDAEVLVEKGSVYGFDESVGVRPAQIGGAMLEKIRKIKQRVRKCCAFQNDTLGGVDPEV